MDHALLNPSPKLLVKLLVKMLVMVSATILAAPALARAGGGERFESGPHICLLLLNEEFQGAAFDLAGSRSHKELAQRLVSAVPSFSSGKQLRKVFWQQGRVSGFLAQVETNKQLEALAALDGVWLLERDEALGIGKVPRLKEGNNQHPDVNIASTPTNDVGSLMSCVIYNHSPLFYLICIPRFSLCFCMQGQRSSGKGVTVYIIDTGVW